MEGQQHKWHNCLESPVTRCESGSHQVSINRQRSLLVVTAVRLPGRLRGGGKVLPCCPLICAFNTSHQHTTLSCYCSSDATHILWLMFYLLLIMLSFYSGLTLRDCVLESFLVQEMFYFETIFCYLTCLLGIVNSNFKLLALRIKILAFDI